MIKDLKEYKEKKKNITRFKQKLLRFKFVEN